MSTWSQSVSLQFTCILSHLSSNITYKRWKKLHQDKTSKTYQILFVQIVGKTTCCFVVVSFKELRKARVLKPTHGVGSRRWRVVRMRYCFFIHLYQALLIDTEKDGRKRENTCCYDLWGRWCEKYNLKANSEHLASTGEKHYREYSLHLFSHSGKARPLDLSTKCSTWT